MPRQLENHGKPALYAAVAALRRGLELPLSAWPLDAVALTQFLDIEVRTEAFFTPGLRGVAQPALRRTLLSSSLTAPRRNFYAAHELCHHLWHAGAAGAKGAYRCFDTQAVNEEWAERNRNAFSYRANRPVVRSVPFYPYVEWQANEGAAELLVPLRIFLPTVQKYKGSFEDDRSFRKFRVYLAGQFRVPVATIIHRFEALRYEIQQFVDEGVPLDEIQVLSAAAQRRAGIQVASYNQRYAVGLTV